MAERPKNVSGRKLALFLSAVSLSLLTACGSDRGLPPVSKSPNAAEPTAPTPSLPAGIPTPEGLTPAQVVRVVDGDTIDVLIGGQQFRLRYIGIDTPETVDPRRPVECYGREASQRNRQLVEGKSVGLERDVSETDKFGRLLRYVWLDPSTGSGQAQMVNATLVAEGFATAATFPPDVKYADTFSALEAEARAAGRGLWGDACPTSAAPPPANPGICEYSGSSAPVIKGNISVSTGEKIYHVPGAEFYDRTIIDEAKGERWFCTEAEALAAGWRRSKR